MGAKSNGEGENSGTNDQDMDEREDWTKIPIAERFSDLILESRDFT